jgi:acetaldehyde dehydrogenase (acetylating)
MKLGGAEKGNAIIILNSAEPPLIHRVHSVAGRVAGRDQAVGERESPEPSPMIKG